MATIDLNPSAGALPSNVDPNGGNDSTAGLQNWLTNGIKNGDPMYLPPGGYSISAPLVGVGQGITLRGAGATVSRLIQTATSQPILHLQVTAGTGPGTPPGVVADIGLQGPTANATNFKAGLLLDATNGLSVERVNVLNMDIGFDFINNCYNCSLWTPSVDRFGSVNVGINLQGFVSGNFQSGNDISIYNALLFPRTSAVCIGGGGGYHFFGGQIGCGTGQTSNQDALAAIMLGYDYKTGLTSACDADFHGTSIEGVNRMWFIQVFDEVVASFHSMGYVASVTGANAALGLLKIGNGKQSQLSFSGKQTIQASGVFQTAICSSSGTFNGAMLIEDCSWYQQALTVNGSARAALSMMSLANEAGSPGLGIGRMRRNGLPSIFLGGTLIRSSAGTNGAFEVSNDTTAATDGTWNMLTGISTNLTAAGTTLGTALQLAATTNIVTTAAGGTGVSLPLTPATSQKVTVKNYGANNLAVYPNTSGTKIGSGAVGVAIVLAPQTEITLAYDGTQWW